MNQQFDLYIIDESLSSVELMVKMLSSYQLKMKTFNDPLEGLRELIDNPAKVVFLEYNMQKINGKDFMVRMSEHYLFQYCSAYLISNVDFDHSTITQLKTLGISQVIRKPFREEEIAAIIVEVFGPSCKKKNVA